MTGSADLTRSLFRLLLLAIVTVLAVLAAIRAGAVDMSLAEFWQAVLGNGSDGASVIVRQLRVPRALQAALCGAALAGSGAAFQALLRNPLAEPYILGVSSGAAVGAVGVVVLGLTLAGAWVIPLAALAGALIAVAVVLRIALGVGSVLDSRVLLLAGVVVGAFFNAAILLLLTFSSLESFRSAIFWMMGSHSGATWNSVGLLALWTLPALFVLFAMSRALNLMAVGELTAAYLGVRVEHTKRIVFAIASLLAAVSVAASGVIGFVGLVVPHTVRLAWGSDHRFLLPASALLGAAFLVLADLLARTVAAPTELPVGVVTAFIGVPFFVWLLRRRGAHA
ncbi:MAG TPA: iron ABC transporter permease [Gemmatimonadales bacterium]|nr:iron ABC transporter permease [Gemmatimonadales bacterium]